MGVVRGDDPGVFVGEGGEEDSLFVWGGEFVCFDEHVAAVEGSSG